MELNATVLECFNPKQIEHFIVQCLLSLGVWSSHIEAKQNILTNGAELE